MKETAMTNLRQLLQRLRAKESKRMISTSMEMHRRVIRKMHKIAVQKEWHKGNNTAVVIQRLLEELFKMSVDVQVIRRYINKNFPEAIKPVMVRSTIPGEDADVDFGDLGTFEDDDGECKKVYLISMRLRHSRKAYRSLVLNQTSNTFNESHIHFEFHTQKS